MKLAKQYTVDDFEADFEYDTETDEMRIWIYGSHFNTNLIVDRENRTWPDFCTHCRLVKDSHLRNMMAGINTLVGSGLSIVDEDESE